MLPFREILIDRLKNQKSLLVHRAQRRELIFISLQALILSARNGYIHSLRNNNIIELETQCIFLLASQFLNDLD